MTVNIGDLAPDFTLKDHNGNDITLSDLRGKKVILSFHPLAFTGVCQVQMQNLEKQSENLEKLGAIGLGLSVDSVPAKKAWSEQIGVIHTPLLADFWPHGKVAKTFGLFREAGGTSERAVLVLDAEGVVRFKKIYPISEQPDIDEIMQAVAAV